MVTAMKWETNRAVRKRAFCPNPARIGSGPVKGRWWLIGLATARQCCSAVHSETKMMDAPTVGKPQPIQTS